MGDDLVKRRDSMKDNPLVPSTPLSSPRRGYEGSNGSNTSEQMFEQHSKQWQEIKQRHSQYPSPPKHTRSALLQQLGLQASQQPQRRSPNVSSSNMIPSYRSGQDSQQVRDRMTIDPRLANASVDVASQGVRSFMKVPMWPVARMTEMSTEDTGSRASTLASEQSALVSSQMPPRAAFALSSPSARSQASGSPASSAVAHTQAMRSLSQQSQQTAARAPSVLPQTPNSRSPSALSYHQAVRSPSQPSPYGTNQTHAARRPIPSYYPSPASTLSPAVGVIRSLPPAQNSFTNGPAPQIGIFAPLTLRSPSARGAIAPLLQKKPLHVEVDKNDESKEVRNKGSTHSKVGLQQKLTLDMMLEKELRKFDSAMVTKAKAWIGNDHNRKQHFIERARAINQNFPAGKMQPPPFVSAATQVKSTHEAIDLTGNKRKAPPTSIVQPDLKRQVVDLTSSKPARKHNPSASHYVTGGFDTSVFPVLPSSSSTNPPKQDLHNQALIHGVCMSDVELGSNIQLAQLAWLQHHQDLRTAHSFLDTEFIAQQYITYKNTNLAPRVFQAEPTIAAAVNKVKAGEYDFSWSGSQGGRLVQLDMNAYDGCIRDGNGELRAPEELRVSEERAKMLWESQASA
jgi:hypothetical protein